MGYLKTLFLGLLLSGVSYSQQVQEPIPFPTKPYILQVTAQKPALEGLLCEATPVGDGLYDVVALVMPGTFGPFRQVDEARKPALNYMDANTVAAMTQEGYIKLRIADGASVVDVSLGGPGLPVVNHNLAMVQGRHISLGKFGHAQVWLSAVAGSKQIDVVLNWHTGRYGRQAPGDFYFQSAQLILPEGITWKANLPDSVSDANWLVKPGNYQFPRQAERPFRFSVYPSGYTYKTPWHGRGVSKGPVPVWDKEPYCPNVVLTAIGDQNNLRNLVPVDGNQAPTSALWPAWGVQYGGMTSGVDMHPMFGVRWYATGQTAGVESAIIEQLRYRVRHFGAIVEAGGAPVKPEAHQDGSWVMFNSLLTVPGQFTFPPRRVTPGTGPEVFSSIDCQHLVREQNHNWMLAYAGDQLARYYIEMEAAKSMLTFWPQAGDRAYRWPNVILGKGTTIGRAEAWAAITIAHALKYGAPIERYQEFIEKYVTTLAAGQMPSGLFQINPGAKESKKPPFAPDGNVNTDGTSLYIIGSGLEESYLITGLYALKPYASEALQIAILDIAARHYEGMKNLAWVPGTSGVWSHSARGPVNTGERYVTRNDWPLELRNALAAGCITCPYIDGYHPYNLGVYSKLGINTETLYGWWTGGQNPRSWGLSRGGTPIENFWINVR